MTPKRLLKTMSIAEAITWTILIAGMVLKYGVGTADWLVTVGGSLHGAVFLSYLFSGLIVGVNQRFTWPQLILGGLASIPPYATLLYDWWAERKGILEGGWRRDRVDAIDAGESDGGARPNATGTPAKLAWLDGLVRWSVGHPITLVCTGVAVFVLILAGAASGSVEAPYETH